MEQNTLNEKVEIRRIFYENGKVQAETCFRNGKVDGVSRTYYESGILLCESNFKDNMMHGPRREYYKSGQLKREDIWKFNKIVGSVMFDEQGNCIAVKSYVA